MNKFKPIINNGSLVRKHLVNIIDSISTNSNPQSIVVLLFLYKEWHHFPIHCILKMIWYIQCTIKLSDCCNLSKCVSSLFIQ